MSSFCSHLVSANIELWAGLGCSGRFEDAPSNGGKDRPVPFLADMVDLFPSWPLDLFPSALPTCLSCSRRASDSNISALLSRLDALLSISMRNLRWAFLLFGPVLSCVGLWSNVCVRLCLCSLSRVFELAGVHVISRCNTNLQTYKLTNLPTFKLTNLQFAKFVRKPTICFHTCLHSL